MHTTGSVECLYGSKEELSRLRFFYKFIFHISCMCVFACFYCWWKANRKFFMHEYISLRWSLWCGASVECRYIPCDFPKQIEHTLIDEPFDSLFLFLAFARRVLFLASRFASCNEPCVFRIVQRANCGVVECFFSCWYSNFHLSRDMAEFVLKYTKSAQKKTSTEKWVRAYARMHPHANRRDCLILKWESYLI